MNFSACWIVSSDIETDVFGVATNVPGLSIECHDFSYQLSLYTSDVNLQVSLLRCIRHSVDGFEQVSSVDCSGIKGVNFQPGILIFCTFSFNSVPAGLCHQISKQVFLVLRPMFQVSVSSC
ncbi:uncharacterized protein [Dysidea avara]|uniref:uncharacterized protein isoform X2 n=1 Tax=Dysidea avara TaxID=196820 RepID=UPI00332ED004